MVIILNSHQTLQAQLVSERAEYETKLKEQALHFKISQNNRSSQSSEIEALRQQIADLHKLTAVSSSTLLALVYRNLPTILTITYANLTSSVLPLL